MGRENGADCTGNAGMDWDKGSEAHYAPFAIESNMLFFRFLAVLRFVLSLCICPYYHERCLAAEILLTTPAQLSG